MNKQFIKPHFSTVGLVARYKLWAGMTTPGQVFDYSLGGKPGTLTGTDIAPDYPGFSFNGSDDYIDVGNQGSGIKTVLLWVNVTSIVPSQGITDINGTDAIDTDGGEIETSGFAGSTIYVDGVAATTITADRWHLIGLTIATAKTASDFDIGKSVSEGFFTGKIGEVLLFNTELSAADMKSIFELTRWRYGV